MHSYFSALSNRAVAYWTAVSFLEHSKSMASVAVSSAICCVVSLLLPVTSPNGQLLNVVHSVYDLAIWSVGGLQMPVPTSRNVQRSYVHLENNLMRSM